MEAFTIEPELLLALALVVAFALGWMAQRMVYARSDRQHFELLNVQIARIEKQRDAAHRVALDLSASYTDLVKEKQDAEARMNRVQADLSGRNAKIEKLAVGYEVRYSDMGKRSPTADKLLQ